MNRKIVCSVIVFLIFIPNLYSFEAKISSDSREIFLNQTFTLNLEIDLEDSKNINIDRIEWIKNFEILWQSQSQQNNSRTTIVNWKTQTLTKQKLNINFVLKPTEHWEYTIWPIVLSDWNLVLETSSINIKVLDNFYNKSDKEKKVDQKNVLHKFYNYIFYSFLLIFVIASFLIFIYYVNKKNLDYHIQNLKNKFNSPKNINTPDKFLHHKLDDFEKSQVINYPTIDDQDFVVKIDNIIKQKLHKKYNLKGIKKLTYSEILQSLDKNLSDTKIVEEIFDKINKLKYSNILISKTQLLELIKKI